MNKVVLFLFLGFSLKAQINSYYWSHQYGAKGQLLNGAVIASCDDETAIFYNPAAMSMKEEFGVSLSLIAPAYSKVNTQNLFGKGTSFSDQGFNLSPGLVAAKFSPFGSKRIQIGVCSFTRFKSDIQYKDRIVDKTTDGTSNIFTGYLNFESKLNESWLGLGASYRIGSTFSLGATQFFSSRNERTLLEFRKEIIDSSNPNALLYGWRSKFEYGYHANGGLLSKFGLLWKPSIFKLGITYTTSTYHLFSAGADYEYDDQKINKNEASSLSGNLRKTTLSQYRTPWSLGVGLEFQWSEKTTVSFSTEYFSDIPTYTLFTDISDPFNGLILNPVLEETTVKNANQAVVNIALGVQKKLGKNTIWLWGLRSDFSPKPYTEIRQSIDFLANSPGLIHISTGGIFTTKNNRLSAGIDFGFGNKSGGQQFTDLSDITPDNIFTFTGDNSVSSTAKILTLSLNYGL